MKPYRLINTFELKQLHQQLTQVIEHWGDDYCMHPLTTEVVKPLKENFEFEVTGIYQNQELLAVTSLDYLSKINQLLFGEDLDDFSPCSQILLDELFQSLYGTIEEPYELRTIQAPLWQYSGSTSLVLKITDADHCLELLLSPEWVYSKLPQKQGLAPPITPINEVVTHEALSLSVDIIIPKLALQDLLGLEPGDILSTDHLLSSPLHLKHGKTDLAEIELGKTLHNKSIQIKRFL